MVLESRRKVLEFDFDKNPVLVAVDNCRFVGCRYMMPGTFHCFARSRVAVERGGSGENSLALTALWSGVMKAGAIFTNFPPSMCILFVCLCFCMLSSSVSCKVVTCMHCVPVPVGTVDTWGVESSVVDTDIMGRVATHPENLEKSGKLN